MMNKSATDESLEQAFFQLAYDKLQGSLKNLLPFLIGFEIVKKNEDSTKALGVFGFRSQSGEILYVPAFFVNGKVKNLDLLYSKNNEQFYPLNEDFAELFLKDDMVDFGSASGETKSNLLRDTQQGDYRQMTVPPRTGKYSIASVVDYVQDSDNKTKQAFKGLIEKDAEFCEAVLRFYPLEKIAAAVVETEDGTKYKEKGDKVKVVTKKDKEDITNLSKEERENLMTQGYVVIDNRPQDAKSRFGVVDYVKKFQNPDQSGFYPYITKAGTINYGLILVRPKQLQQNFATDDAVVIDLDASEKGTAYLKDVKRVFVKDQIRVEDYSEVHKMMVDPAEGKPGYSSVYVLVNEKLKATQPFRINANFKDANGIRRISVEPWGAHPDCGMYPDYQGKTDRPGSAHDLPRGNFYDHPKKKQEMLLVMTKRPGDELSYDGSTVYVPAGYKLLEVKIHNNSRYNGPAAIAVSKKEKQEEDKRVREEESAKTRQMKGEPGCMADLNGFLTEKNVFPMTVRTNGSEYFLNIAGAKKQYDDPIKAKIAMVTELGLDYKEASELVDTLVPGKTVQGHLKKAYTGDVTPTPYEEQPYTNEIGQPTYVGIGQESRAPGDLSYSGNPSQLGLGTMPEVHGIDPQYVQQAIQLAQNGQKEIFDVQSMATLAKYVGVNDKITEYLPSLVEGMDRLGRILFLLHWDTDKFVDMYGRNDLPELVELVTSVFKNLGDLIIFLKRKSPELSINMTKDDALDV
jgi:hypothetical protein